MPHVQLAEMDHIPLGLEHAKPMEMTQSGIWEPRSISSHIDRNLRQKQEDKTVNDHKDCGQTKKTKLLMSIKITLRHPRQKDNIINDHKDHTPPIK